MEPPEVSCAANLQRNPWVCFKKGPGLVWKKMIKKFRNCLPKRGQSIRHSLNHPVYIKGGFAPSMQWLPMQTLRYPKWVVDEPCRKKNSTMHWHWWPKGILGSSKSHIWSLLPDPNSPSKYWWRKIAHWQGIHSGTVVWTLSNSI